VNDNFALSFATLDRSSPEAPISVLANTRPQQPGEFRSTARRWHMGRRLSTLRLGSMLISAGIPWLYFIDQHHRVRHDLFGFGSDTGLVAPLLFLLLLAISNDLWLRRLGTRKWKSLQRWTYVAVVLTILHAVRYQPIERRPASLVFEAVVWGTSGIIVALQLRGWSQTKGRHQTLPSSWMPDQIRVAGQMISNTLWREGRHSLLWR
jgi:hypothetical protein